MAYFNTGARLGVQSVTEASATRKHPVGAMHIAFDQAVGEGEFVYLSGAAGTVPGDVVSFNSLTGETARLVTGARGAAAVAVVAVEAGQFGWYQVGGSAAVRVGVVAASGDVFATATPGLVDDAVSAGNRVDGMRFKTVEGSPSTGFAVAFLSRPSLNGSG